MYLSTSVKQSHTMNVISVSMLGVKHNMSLHIFFVLIMFFFYWYSDMLGNYVMGINLFYVYNGQTDSNALHAEHSYGRAYSFS